MFARVELLASDLKASRAFYETVLDALPIAPSEHDAHGRALAWGEFALLQAPASAQATRHLHVGFAAPSRDAVDAFWDTGVRAGWRDDGRPGPRPQYVEDYYGAFLLDPDGNSVEAVHYADVRDDGAVDHLWIRVADLAVTRRWWEALAPQAELAVGDGREPTRFHVRSDPERPRGGSFALVADGRLATRRARIALASPGTAAAGVHVDPDGNRVELLHSPSWPA